MFISVFNMIHFLSINYNASWISCYFASVRVSVVIPCYNLFPIINKCLLGHPFNIYRKSAVLDYLSPSPPLDV